MRLGHRKRNNNQKAAAAARLVSVFTLNQVNLNQINYLYARDDFQFHNVHYNL